MRLFSLPPAGGGKASFHAWKGVFPPGVEVRPLSMPGREGRINEPCAPDPDRVADELLSLAEDEPYALYGHSMGAWLAYEVTDRIRRRGARLPLVLFAAAALSVRLK